MTSKVNTAVEIYHDEGFIPLLNRSVRYGYDTFIRPHLLDTNAEYNGVKVQNAKVCDRLLPWYTVDIPGYESALVGGIREHVRPGDQVVVVGGGWGVSTVAAARQAGATGRVDTFEGSKGAIENVTSTVRMNDVGDRVTTHHTVVGRAHSLRGEQGSADIVQPTELPECDVLVLDCEGAELEILDDLSVTPQTILVETHGMLGAPEHAIENRLTQASYEVISREVAEDRVRDYCIENEIFVLTAKQIT